jgi:hypothetical protein
MEQNAGYQWSRAANRPLSACHCGDSAAGMFRQQRRRLSVYLTIVVNLPARLKNEQPNADAAQSDHAEHYKKCPYSLHSKRFNG